MTHSHSSSIQRETRSHLFTVSALALAIASTSVSAQETSDQPQRGSALSILEEVTVTARKREESAQDVPLSISAFGSEQIDALKVRDLTNLSVGMPNVALDDIGTSRGTANFSIRGLGINSSIPSIDPTVGIFVDGVYMGVNNGIILDTFDLESIEVLRGPQGILFGRNVTGGAVLMKTKRPGDELEVKVRTAVEGGGEELNTYAMSSISGPITDSLGGKLVLYYNNDDGWFENLATNDEFGENRTKMARGVLDWDPTDKLNVIARYEYSESDGDGPASQSHTNGSGVPNAVNNYDRDSFNFSVDEEGFLKTRTNFLALEANYDVEFGDGTVTGIFGWRDNTQTGIGDIDASSQPYFHAPSWLEAEQYSYELRYNGQFDKLNLTAGIYHFTNEIDYHERRLLAQIPAVLGGIQYDGGGEYEVETTGVFIAGDYDLSERLTLSAGLRYTKEEKEAKLASLNENITTLVPTFPLLGPRDDECNIVTNGDCPFDFVDDEDWSNWSPKVGLTYDLDEETIVYTHWSRGFRSGGYNLRNTSFTVPPASFDEEQVDNFEVGIKREIGQKGRINAALFYNKIDDMQRELNLPNEGAGVVQLVRNTADASIVGLEIDGMYAITEQLLLTASVGYIDAEYDDVKEDLNGDNVVDSADEKLDLPRAAEWTYSIGLSHDLPLGDVGYITSRINYAYRDESAYTDSNLGFIDKQKILDAGIDFYSNDGHWNIGLYGRNLLDEVKHGGDTQLPDDIAGVPTGGTFSPLAKGRVYGLDVTYTF
ncbi:TonB-dependent receptor [Maricurvus nonylphenolicus]|uniref:TonB-dependent receptor n=1 Tax=Maricurvus nonylphenolicus TaxID=1008307 RepID=UPI0036F31E72